MSIDRKRILLCDDSQNYVVHMSTLLKRFGFGVIPAENGLETLKLLTQIQPDLLMLDVIMKMVDGVTVLKYIKESADHSRLPVVMVSEDRRPETRERCFKLGCAAYVNKPVDINELHEVLQDCLFSRGGTNRKHLRATYREKLAVKHGGQTYDLYAESLSEGGVYVRKKDPLPVGSQVEVSVPMPGGEAVPVRGSVIYVRNLYEGEMTFPPGMAIQFGDVPKDRAHRLKRRVSDLVAGDILDSQEEPVIRAD
jgi:uncharacterized protein (TIGR02266 family)